MLNSNYAGWYITQLFMKRIITSVLFLCVNMLTAHGDQTNVFFCSFSTHSMLGTLASPVVLTGNTSTFTSFGNFSVLTNSLWIEIYDPSTHSYWDMIFKVPGDEPFVPGLYTAATRFPFQDEQSPGMDFSALGRGYNELEGWFRILDVGRDGLGEVTSVAIDFWQHGEPSIHVYDMNEFGS